MNFINFIRIELWFWSEAVELKITLVKLMKFFMIFCLYFFWLLRMGNNRPTTRSKNKRSRNDDNAEATAETFRWILFLFFNLGNFFFLDFYHLYMFIQCIICLFFIFLLHWCGWFLEQNLVESNCKKKFFSWLNSKCELNFRVCLLSLSCKGLNLF